MVWLPQNILGVCIVREDILLSVKNIMSSAMTLSKVSCKRQGDSHIDLMCMHKIHNHLRQNLWTLMLASWCRLRSMQHYMECGGHAST